MAKNLRFQGRVGSSVAERFLHGHKKIYRPPKQRREERRRIERMPHICFANIYEDLEMGGGGLKQ